MIMIKKDDVRIVRHVIDTKVWLNIKKLLISDNIISRDLLQKHNSNNIVTELFGYVYLHLE